MHGKWHTIIAGQLVVGLCAVISISLLMPAIAREPDRKRTSSKPSSPLPLEVDKLPTDVEEVLWWLPENMETLIVTRGTSAASKPVQHTGRVIIETRLINGRPTSVAIDADTKRILPEPSGEFGRAAVEKNQFFFKQFLSGVAFECVISAARRFQTQATIPGITYFEGTVLLLYDPAGVDNDELLSRVSKDAAHVELRGEHRVASINTEQEWFDGTLTIQVAILRPGILVACTDRALLNEMLERFHQRGSIRSFPESLPEWRHVNTSSRTWGMRHLSQSGMHEGGIGFTFSYDPDDREVVLGYVSDSAKRDQHLSETWMQHTGNSAKATPYLDDGAQLRAKVSGSPQREDEMRASDLTFLIWHLMGHAVFL